MHTVSAPKPCNLRKITLYQQPKQITLQNQKTENHFHFLAKKNIFPCRSKPLCFGVCQVCKAETGGSFLVDHFLSSFAPSGFEAAADLKQRQELIFHAEHSWAAAVCRHRHCSKATTLVEERCCRTNSQSRQKMSIRGESLNEGSSNPPCITRRYFSGTALWCHDFTSKFMSLWLGSN